VIAGVRIRQQRESSLKSCFISNGLTRHASSFPDVRAGRRPMRSRNDDDGNRAVCSGADFTQDFSASMPACEYRNERSYSFSKKHARASSPRMAISTQYPSCSMISFSVSDYPVRPRLWHVNRANVGATGRSQCSLPRGKSGSTGLTGAERRNPFIL